MAKRAAGQAAFPVLRRLRRGIRPPDRGEVAAVAGVEADLDAVDLVEIPVKKRDERHPTPRRRLASARGALPGDRRPESSPAGI